VADARRQPRLMVVDMLESSGSANDAIGGVQEKGPRPLFLRSASPNRTGGHRPQACSPARRADDAEIMDIPAICFKGAMNRFGSVHQPASETRR